MKNVFCGMIVLVCLLTQATKAELIDTLQRWEELKDEGEGLKVDQEELECLHVDSSDCFTMSIGLKNDLIGDESYAPNVYEASDFTTIFSEESTINSLIGSIGDELQESGTCIDGSLSTLGEDSDSIDEDNWEDWDEDLSDVDDDLEEAGVAHSRAYIFLDTLLPKLKTLHTNTQYLDYFPMHEARFKPYCPVCNPSLHSH